MSISIGHRSQALTDRASIHDPIVKAGMATAHTSREALAAPMMDLALASSKVMSPLGQWWHKKSITLPLRDSAGISFALAWNQRASKTAPCPCQEAEGGRRSPVGLNVNLAGRLHYWQLTSTKDRNASHPGRRQHRFGGDSGTTAWWSGCPENASVRAHLGLDVACISLCCLCVRHKGTNAVHLNLQSYPELSIIIDTGWKEVREHTWGGGGGANPTPSCSN